MNGLSRTFETAQQLEGGYDEITQNVTQIFREIKTMKGGLKKTWRIR